VTEELMPYPEYKESGLPWLGRIPSHWETRRNGRLFAQRNETGFPDLPVLEVSLKTGIKVRHFGDKNRKQVIADRAKYKRAVQRDIAYNMMRLWQGAVGVTPVDGLVSPAYVVAKPYPGTNSRYCAYLFRTAAYMNEVNKYSRGIVTDRNRLYWDEFKQMPSAFPAPREQGEIVDYLDHQAVVVNRLIRTKLRQIELLNEQKHVIIHRAVTRGLDSNVRLKPSGIPWLGDVPEHWEVLALGRICTSRCDGPFGSSLKSMHYTDSGVRVIRLQNIGNGQFRSREPAFISPEHYATLGDHGVVCGDILVAGLGDENTPAGRACVAPKGMEPAMVKADCFRFRLRPGRVLPEYLALHLSATAPAATACLSTGATRLRTNLSATAARSISFPPLPEQERILRSILDRTQIPTKAIAPAQREIDLIREYRTRLIADVVTGQLDVREAARHLPADAEEPEAIVETEEDTELNAEDADE
jgi:type I restriction enzyme S subunit